MPNNWKTYKLSDTLEIKYGKDHKKISKGNIPIYGTGGIMRYGNQALYDRETILIPRKGSLNNIFYLNEPFWTVDTIFWSKIKDKIALPKYLFYNLKVIDFSSMDVGSAIPSLTTELLKKIEIDLPPLPEQQAIASILSAIDDKIENNLAINKTLEEMAMAQYKHWFVDFGPFQDGEFVESELGLIPKDWEVKRLDEICNITIGRTPPRKEPQWFSKDIGIKWISIKDLGNSGIYISETSEYLSEEAIKKYKIPVISPNTVLLSFKLTVGRVAITSERMLSNEAIAHLNIKNEKLPTEFLYSYLKSFDYNSLGSTSSIATAVNTQTIKAMKIVIPNNFQLENYLNKVKFIFELIKINQKENQSLTQLRDTLLPKLISGEVRLKAFRDEN